MVIYHTSAVLALFAAPWRKHLHQRVRPDGRTLHTAVRHQLAAKADSRAPVSMVALVVRRGCREETMATSEEAETPRQQHSSCPNRRLSVCLSCVTDVSNCLLGVMFLSYEHNSENNDIDSKKNGLYIKIERNR